MERPKVPEGVMDTIRRLAEMKVERGCTPAEAAGAAAKLEELLERWQLSLFDVRTGEYAEEVGEESLTFPGRATPAWVWALARAVSRPHDCNYLVNVYYDRERERWMSALKFVGHRSDAAVASYLYDTLQPLLMGMADREGRALGRRSHALISFKSQYVQAAAAMVFNRLWRERKAARDRIEEAAAAGAGTTALVVVKEQAVAEYMKHNYPKITVTGGSRAAQDDVEAIALGRRAGRSVELKKGIETQQTPRLT